MARFFDKLIEKIQTDGVDEVLRDANTFNNENYTYHGSGGSRKLDPFSVPCGSPSRRPSPCGGVTSGAQRSGGRPSGGRSDNQPEMADILGKHKY